MQLNERFDDIAKNIDIYDVISRYRGPVLLIHGSADPIVHPDYSKRAMDVFENAEYLELPGAGHGFSGEQCDQAVEHSLAFVTKIEKGAKNSIRKQYRRRRNLQKNKYEIDMCQGTIMDKLITFALPLMLSGILQLMFNAVDIIVVGRFSGSQALAAVGSTTALINVFTNLFIGISLGSNVLAARLYAAGKEKEMSEVVHTSIAMALVSGVVMGIIGVLFAGPALEVRGPRRMSPDSRCFTAHLFSGRPFFML